MYKSCYQWGRTEKYECFILCVWRGLPIHEPPLESTLVLVSAAYGNTK